MAEYSLYKSLELPSSTEHYNIGVFNKNTMVIDSELHKLDLRNESLSNHTADELNPHKVNKSQIELGNVDNTSDINKPVSTAQQNAIDEALYQSNCYTDTKIAELINGAPETLDTLKEIADAIEEDKTIVEVLDAAIGAKASQNELNTHINNDVIHVTQSDKNDLNIAKEHADSQHARVDATKVERSDINGNVKINGVETNVYTPPSSTILPLTTSLTETEEGVAALDSTVGKVLKDEIDEINNNLPQFIYDEEGKITGYKTAGGADAVFPFSSGKIKRTTIYSGNSRNSHTIDIKQYDGYKNFTLDNFALENAKILYLRDNVDNNTDNILSKYDAENGLLYLASSAYTASTNVVHCVSYSVVLIT